MEVTETEPGTRWSATDGTHEAQAFVGRLSRSFGWLSVDEQVPVPLVEPLAHAALGAQHLAGQHEQVVELEAPGPAPLVGRPCSISTGFASPSSE